MEKDRERRPRDAQALLKGLKSLDGGLPYAALAYIALKTGDFNNALMECDLSIQSIGPDDDAYIARRHALHLKGLVYVEMGDAKKRLADL